jgi:hypothetical protein
MGRLHLLATAAALLLAGLCSAALPPLPQGAGLAASYVNDSGIAADPAVLFAENFERFSGQQITWSDIGDFDNVYGTLSITRDAAETHAGAQSVSVTHTGTGTHGADKEVPGHDTLFVRFYMRFSPSFPGVHHAGMGIRGGPPDALFTNPTGIRPNGTNHFMCYLDHLSPLHSWNPPGNDTPPGYAYDYCYHMDQASNYGDNILPSGLLNGTYPFSDDFVPLPDVVPPLDHWNCYEIMVRCNAPSGADGRVGLWIDGELVADHPGLRFRTTSSITARYVSLSTYSSQYVAGQTLWYDDIVMATAYIGPMGSGAAVAPLPTYAHRPAGNGLVGNLYDLRGRPLPAQRGGAPGARMERTLTGSAAVQVHTTSIRGACGSP